MMLRRSSRHFSRSTIADSVIDSHWLLVFPLALCLAGSVTLYPSSAAGQWMDPQTPRSPADKPLTQLLHTENGRHLRFFYQGRDGVRGFCQQPEQRDPASFGSGSQRRPSGSTPAVRGLEHPFATGRILSTADANFDGHYPCQRHPITAGRQSGPESDPGFLERRQTCGASPRMNHEK